MRARGGERPRQAQARRGYICTVRELQRSRLRRHAHVRALTRVTAAISSWLTGQPAIPGLQDMGAPIHALPLAGKAIRFQAVPRACRSKRTVPSACVFQARTPRRGGGGFQGSYRRLAAVQSVLTGGWRRRTLAV